MHSSRNHACPPEQPCTHPPQSNHACPPWATMHTPLEQPCMPPQSNHACPPGATTYAPPVTTHAPWSNHACPPGATTHTPRATTHTLPPEQPRMPPPVNRMTNWCKNITLPQTWFAGGKKSNGYSRRNLFQPKYGTFSLSTLWNKSDATLLIHTLPNVTKVSGTKVLQKYCNFACVFNIVKLLQTG